VRLHPLPDRLRRAVVSLLGGADVIVVRAVHAHRQFLEARYGARSQLLRGDPLLGRGLQHLDAVLVGAGEEEHVVAVETLEPRTRVGRDQLIGEADMRRAIGIGDGRRDVVAGLVSHGALRDPMQSRHAGCRSGHPRSENLQEIKDVDGRASPAMTSPGIRINGAPPRQAHGPRTIGPPGVARSGYYGRAASASQPNTENTSGLRSRLYSSASRAA